MHDDHPERLFFFFKQKTAYEMRISDWSSDVCSSDLPTAHNVKIFGSAATHVHDSCGSGDPIFVHGLERTESWGDNETGEKRTKDVVVVDSRFGEVGEIDRASSRERVWRYV